MLPNPVAYLWADHPTATSQPAPASYAFSSSGGAILVSRAQVGEYTVSLAGLGGNNGTVHVTPYGDLGIQCSTSSWSSKDVAEQRVYVSCFGPKGEPLDSPFMLTYTR